MTSEAKNTFLSLVKQGIGHHKDAVSPVVDWQTIETLANEQGLLAVLVDGVERLNDDSRPPKELLLQWIGETLQNYEYRYENYRKIVGAMAGFYNSHGYKMMVLKGFGCSLNWSKPEHRPCGDIDIWQFGKQKEADAAIVKEKGIEVDNSHHHHSVFNWGEFLVENHYDFINVHHHQSNSELESIFKELGKDDSHFVEVSGERVYLPSPNLHALFLLKHSMNDFTSFSVTLRQLLDWAFFVEKHTKEIDWEWLDEQLERFYMKDFFNCINAICVENLGFSPTIFPSIQFPPSMKEKVLNDILEPKYSAEEPQGLIKRLVYKYRRWKGNEWKHKMCYNESLWSSFWYGVWGHLLKPKSI